MSRRQRTEERQQLDHCASKMLELHQNHLDAASAGEDLLALCHEAGVVGQGLHGIEPDLLALKVGHNYEDKEPEPGWLYLC